MNTALSLKDDESLAKLEQWATNGQLYALLDPFFDVPIKSPRARLETKDTDPVFYEVIAWDQVTYEPPSIIQVTPEALDWIMNSLSTERWGVFIVSDEKIETLARHYQKFVIARGPDLNPYFLRFHDASVLDVLIQTWDAKDKSVFFGPTRIFGLPDLDTMAVRFVDNPFGTNRQPLPLPEDCLLQLREGQLRLCGEAIDRDLVKVIYWHMRNHHSKSVQFLERDSLEERIRFAIQKARKYSLGTVADLAGFTALMFELAPNFDDHPSFRAVLLDINVPPEAKMKKLSQVITDREWNEAVRLYDRDFWGKVLKDNKDRSRKG